MQVELNPWPVPEHVTAKMSPRPRQDIFKETPWWTLNEVDADTLAIQCDRFRTEVFRIAGKPDPVKSSVWTGLVDELGCRIHVGDLLYNQFAKYHVIVQLDTDGSYSGKLVCDPSHSCANIPYHLNGGKDHINLAVGFGRT